MTDEQLNEKLSEAGGLELTRNIAHMQKNEQQGGVAIEHIIYSIPYSDDDVEQRALDERDDFDDMIESRHDADLDRMANYNRW